MNDKRKGWIACLGGLAIIAFAMKDCSNGGSKPLANLSGTGGAVSYATTPAGRNGAAAASLNYWHSFNRIFGQLMANMKSRPDQQIAALRLAAGQCRNHPTLGVDPDLVSWVLEAANVLDGRADLLDRSNDPAALVEAFARIANGDTAGLAIDVSQAAQQWLAQSRKVLREDSARIRALMTSRYGIEFTYPQQ